MILVVDDDADTREMYGWCLEESGFRVLLAGSVDEALAQAAVELPDVLITDFMLPGGDGFMLAETLRRMTTSRHVTMILLSGRDFAGEAHTRASEIFERVLLKPVLPDELAGAVASLSANRA